MAHKKNDKESVLIDWTTGDLEGNRFYIFCVYRSFFKELKKLINEYDVYCDNKFKKLLKDWRIEELNVDEFPRIGISYPESFPENLKGKK